MESRRVSSVNMVRKKLLNFVLESYFAEKRTPLLPLPEHTGHIGISGNCPIDHHFWYKMDFCCKKWLVTKSRLYYWFMFLAVVVENLQHSLHALCMGLISALKCIFKTRYFHYFVFFSFFFPSSLFLLLVFFVFSFFCLFIPHSDIFMPAATCNEDFSAVSSLFQSLKLNTNRR